MKANECQILSLKNQNVALHPSNHVLNFGLKNIPRKFLVEL